MHDGVDVLTLRFACREEAIEIEMRGDRSAFLPAYRAIVIADLHLGKAEVFQRRGVAVPGGSDHVTFDRLERAVQDRSAKEVWILGDLFHDPTAIAEERRKDLLRTLRAACRVPALMIRGNHDRRWQPDADAGGGGLALVDEPHHLDGVTLRHTPPDVGAPDVGAHAARSRALQSPYLAGHLHPVARVSAPGERLRLPCFVASTGGIVLPAFGDFAGGFEMEPNSQRRLVAAWEGALIDLG